MRDSFQLTEEDVTTTAARGKKRSREDDLYQQQSNIEKSDDDWQDTQTSVEESNEIAGYSTYKADDLKDEETPTVSSQMSETETDDETIIENTTIYENNETLLDSDEPLPNSTSMPPTPPSLTGSLSSIIE